MRESDDAQETVVRLKTVTAERLQVPHHPGEEAARYRAAALRALHGEPDVISAPTDESDPDMAPSSGDLYSLRRLGSRTLESELARRQRWLFDFLLGLAVALIGVVAVAAGWSFG